MIDYFWCFLMRKKKNNQQSICITLHLSKRIYINGENIGVKESSLKVHITKSCQNPLAFCIQKQIHSDNSHSKVSHFYLTPHEGITVP